MSYRKTSNHAQINSEVTNGASLAIRLMLSEIHRLADPVTPKDKGNLRADVLKEVRGTTGKITWTKEYAIYQETKQFQNYTTPGTGPHFAEKSVVDVVDRSDTFFKRTAPNGR